MTAARSSALARATLLALALTLGCGAAAATPLKLPPTTKTKLKNGLTVLVVPTARLPLVDFRLVVHAGSVNDPKDKEGLASLTADLLTQGAGKRNAKQIAEDAAFIGGELNASAAAEQLVVTCEVLKKDFATGLELFHDVIVMPTFPAEEFDRKKDEALGAIASAKDDPGTVADKALGPFLLGDSPLAHPVDGWERSVKALAREDVVGFHHQHVTPDHALLAVVGDVEPKAVIAALEREFADWKPAGTPDPDAYEVPEQVKGRQVLIVEKPEVTQTQIRMACIGIARSDPDFYPIQVANTILGGGFTARLVNEIRVVQGLTYSIGSGFGMFRKTGTFRITTFTKNETLRKTIDEALKVEKKLVDQGPTDEELARAKRYLTGLFPLGLQAPDQLAAQVLNVEFYGLDPHYLESYSEKINAVTMEDCRRVLKSHFCTDDLRILVVSNPATAKTALNGLGALRVEKPQ